LEVLRVKAGSKIYYTRVLLGVGVGLFSGWLYLVLPLGLLQSLIPSILAVLVYVGSFYLITRVLRIKAEDLNNPAFLKTGGIFAYFLTWLVFWSLYLTFTLPPS